MNTRFTIEEENIVAIYAEDSRERTIDNINSAMPPCPTWTRICASLPPQR